MNINFKKDTEIDAGNLDQEWVNLSRVAAEYSEMLVDANDLVRRSEQRLKILRSEITLKIKDLDPKATAPIIESTYRTNKEHIAEKEIWMDAARDAEMLQHACNKLNDKKKALEELCKLEARNYFTGSDIPRSMPTMNRERIQEIQNKDSQGVANKIQERMSRRTT